MEKMKKKLIVILGPTASGKSELAVKLALCLGSKKAKKLFKINGAEIISADSRQVYKGMDIGSGKITKQEMKGVPHHLLDVALPKRKFTVAQYRKLAQKSIGKILKNNKVPVLCGGTGFYVQAVIDGLIFPEVKPDWKLRRKLEKMTAEKLYEMLKKLDPRRAKNIDRKNPRRLIRAIEIVKKTKKAVPLLRFRQGFSGQAYPLLMLGIKKEKKELSSLIKKRLLKRLKNQEMIKEVKKLRQSGISWKRLEEFGLEYRFVAQYLQEKINYGQMIEFIQKESEHFTKRQMTWFNHQIDDFTAQNSSKKNFGEFKKDKRIKWIKNYKKAEKLAREFLLQN